MSSSARTCASADRVAVAVTRWLRRTHRLQRYISVRHDPRPESRVRSRAHRPHRRHRERQDRRRAAVRAARRPRHRHRQIARESWRRAAPALAQIVAPSAARSSIQPARLDRQRMRETGIRGSGTAQTLEAILHPAIREELARRSAQCGRSLSDSSSIPLLVESVAADAYDRVLVVDCTEETQMQRLHRARRRERGTGAGDSRRAGTPRGATRRVPTT